MTSCPAFPATPTSRAARSRSTPSFAAREEEELGRYSNRRGCRRGVRDRRPRVRDPRSPEHHSASPARNRASAARRAKSSPSLCWGARRTISSLLRRRCVTRGFRSARSIWRHLASGRRSSTCNRSPAPCCIQWTALRGSRCSALRGAGWSSAIFICSAVRTIGSLARGAVSRQIEEHLPLLGDESRARVNRVLSVLQAALDHRHRQSSFASWIERTWNSLGGPACVDAAGYENARAYFRMLEQVSPDGIDATGEAMKQQLNRLFANPDPSVAERCGVQLMTMHKAKGLGFNVVLLPGLDRTTVSYAPTLIRYLERATATGTELLVAPIDDAGEEPSPLNRWVRLQKENREAEERKRLLYVACTRAREELHLFATATVTNRGLSCRAGSLLSTAWPALQKDFEERYAEANSADPLGKLLDFPSTPAQPVGLVLDTVAAESGRATLHRLPSDWKPSPVPPNISWRRTKAISVPVEDARRKDAPRGLSLVANTRDERSCALRARRPALPSRRFRSGASRRSSRISSSGRGARPERGSAAAGDRIRRKAGRRGA